MLVPGKIFNYLGQDFDRNTQLATQRLALPFMVPFFKAQQEIAGAQKARTQFHFWHLVADALGPDALVPSPRRLRSQTKTMTYLHKGTTILFRLVQAIIILGRRLQCTSYISEIASTRLPRFQNTSSTPCLVLWKQQPILVSEICKLSLL